MLTLYDSGVTALAYSLAFAVGGAAGGLVTWLRSRPRPPVRPWWSGSSESLGTGVGVTAAVALAGIVGQSTAGVAILFLATALLMMSAREVNDALFAMLAAALARLAATVIGVVIAFVVLGLVDAAARTKRATG